MKRAWLALTVVVLMGMVINTYADVQNIRLSGDIRLRGYYLNNVADLGASGDVEDSFVSQRTRVTVEADLEDHVLVVVTLAAEGLWGNDNDVHTASGAGTGEFDAFHKINRSWDTGVDEAYVQFNEMFFTPATLKLGRQYLNYGRGLILSSNEQEYNYDAARLVLDYYPLTIDLVYAKLVENTPFGTGTGDRDADLYFLNARYEMTDSVIKDIEGYFGYVANSMLKNSFDSGDRPQAPPTFDGASPLIFGLRGDLALTKELTMWLEGAYEFGADGAGHDESISAWLFNVGAKYAIPDTQWSPVLNCAWTFATGGGDDDSGYFRPWFDYVEGYNGYVLHPLLTNIHIFNLGASVKPYENTTLSVQGYYYLKADQDGVVVQNPNYDIGGFLDVSSEDSDIGWGIDTVLGYDYSKDVSFQLVYGMFIPGRAFHEDDTFDATAHEVRVQAITKF